MDRINVDINETEIFNLYPEVLETLLKDHTTGRNIFGQRIRMHIEEMDFSIVMP